MKLSDTHLVLLSAAAQNEAYLLPRPNRISDKAIQALALKLVRAGLADEVSVLSDQPHWRADDDARIGLRITRKGLAAIGLNEADEPSAPTPEREKQLHPTRAPRAGSKQAAILALLGREEGAALADLIAATGWLPHTTRAALTGLRQRGYRLARSKAEDGRTLYRVQSDAAASVVSNEKAC
jgi:Protein of unknown function (DUF3489)